MTRKKKFLVGLLLLVVLSQLPFAYRRYKIGRLHSAIQNINAGRVPDPGQSAFSEYVGVIHVHSFLGGHSKGSFDEIISAARSNQLNFVVMTEHTSGDFNTAAMTLKGMHAGVLFVNGNEVSSANSDRLLIIPGDEAASGQSLQIEELLTTSRSRGALSFVAYPEEFKSWGVNGVDGVEVYNVYTNARSINPLVMFFDGLWTYRNYPELLFANFYRRPDENLQRWDAAVKTSGRRWVAVAGNDAHSNVGINLQDSSGKSLLGLHLDPYARSFKLVRVHALIPKNETLSAETLLKALASGHCFIGFDLFGDTSGFSFSARDADESRIQGDEITLNNQVRLEVKTPVRSRIVLFKDGSRVEDRTGQNSQEFLVTEKGSYRVEVYLPQLPSTVSEQPWIISNPIYVR